VNLLLDQNISRRLVPALEFHFPGTTQAALVDLDKVDDLEIRNYAKEHGYIIVTKDSDFEELSVLMGAPPKVIWIKLGNTGNQIILEALIKNKDIIIETLRQAEVSCLEIF